MPAFYDLGGGTSFQYIHSPLQQIRSDSLACTYLPWDVLHLADQFHGAPHREIQCRVCREDPIRGTRILCITCGMTDPINLCDKERCLTTVTPAAHNRAFLHSPSHDILKLRTSIHPIREYGEVYRAAQSATERLRQIFADLPSTSRGSRKSESSMQFPQCVSCHGSVKSLPCWYCIECEGMSSSILAVPVRRLTPDAPESIYICVLCEAKYGGITSGNHQDSHALVQCQYIQTPTGVECEHSSGGHLCKNKNERRQPIDEFLHHPLKAAGALGSKAAASLQNACVHA